MGAGQIGGIATLLDIDFNNAAGFVGKNAELTEAQYIVYYLSHTLLFCTGALIEAHVVITPAICVYSEKYKFDVFAGTHRFLENTGSFRTVENLCVHRGYNKSSCYTDNIALLVLRKQFSLRDREPYSDFTINRVRYGVSPPEDASQLHGTRCSLYGWGSRRNGYLVPLLFNLRKVDFLLLPCDKCDKMWNYGHKYLCVQQPRCKDDVGSILVCSGFAQGMMVSRLMDRPCGVGLLDLGQYSKFLTCGVDDSRDVNDEEVNMEVSFEDVTLTALRVTPATMMVTPPSSHDATKETFRQTAPSAPATKTSVSPKKPPRGGQHDEDYT